MENQLWHDALGCCSQYQESPQDAENSLFLLLSFIILINISINVATAMWNGLQNALDKITYWINRKNEVQAGACTLKDLPSKAQDVHIRCILDPVRVKMAQPTLCFSSSCHRLHNGHSHHRCHQCRSHSCQQRPQKCKQFPKGFPGFQYQPHSYKTSRLQPMPFFDWEDQDSYLEQSEDLSSPVPKYPCQGRVGLNQQTDLPYRVGLWGRQGGILASLPLTSLYLSPELRCVPRRVEAKSELRLQSRGPQGSQGQIRSSVQAEQSPASLLPPRRLPPKPHWGPGGPSPYSSRGHILCDISDQPRHGVGSSEPARPSGSLNPQPEAQAYRELHCPLSQRCSPLSHAHSRPKHSPHSSTLGLSSRDTHKTTSTSLTILAKATYQRTPAASSALLPPSSKPLLDLASLSTPPHPPSTFTLLSRSPGGIANCQVYDSLELKRQVQESRAQRLNPAHKIEVRVKTWEFHLWADEGLWPSGGQEGDQALDAIRGFEAKPSPESGMKGFGFSMKLQE
ncbi:LOW QUALITY PROTEIN: uncharacterized protein SPEM2-like [Ctenodactylus gundi]